MIEIYKKAHEKSPALSQVLDLCYEFIKYKFSIVVKSKEFRELPEDLMRNILKNVIPKLTKLDKKQETKIDDNNDDDDDDDDDNDDDNLNLHKSFIISNFHKKNFNLSFLV